MSGDQDYDHLVERIAGRIYRRFPVRGSCEFQDLLQDGRVGLLQALRRFDPSRGVRFEAYACKRIRGAILNGISGLRHISRASRLRVRELKQAEDQLAQILGRVPRQGELAAWLNLSEEELGCRLGEREVTLFFAFDPESRLLSQNDPALEHWLEFQEMLQALRRLSQKHRKVLYFLYFENASMKTVSRLMGLSPARISQLHERAVALLRESWRGRMGVFNEAQ